MLKTISQRAKAFLLSNVILTAACTHLSPQTASRIEMEKPLIQNLSTAHPQMQNLKHSLVRLRLQDGQKQSSYGTGFFFKSRDLLVTTLHTFDQHECLEKKVCEIFIGFAKDEKDVNETSLQVSVALRDSDKDLLFLSVKNPETMAHVKPLALPRSSASQKQKVSERLIAAGFFQDGSALTFSHGKASEQNRNETATTIIVGHGFSGAPVVNEFGELVGVVSSYHPLQNNKEIGLARYVDIN
jgi:S1-C subfamily serine protease